MSLINKTQEVPEGKETIVKDEAVFDLSKLLDNQEGAEYEEEETPDFESDELTNEDDESSYYNAAEHQEDYKEGEVQGSSSDSVIMEAQARQMIGLLDMIFCRAGSFISGQDKSNYQITKDEKSELTDNMRDYMIATNFKPSPTATLIAALTTVFGIGVLGDAYADNKRNKAKEQVSNLKIKAMNSGTKKDEAAFREAKLNEEEVEEGFSNVRQNFDTHKKNGTYQYNRAGTQYIKVSDQIEKPPKDLYLEIIKPMAVAGNSGTEINDACKVFLSNKGVTGYNEG